MSWAYVLSHLNDKSKDVVPRRPQSGVPIQICYSIFDSALYRNLDLKWLFPQEKATLHDT
jgi:hypothetical protein